MEVQAKLKVKTAKTSFDTKNGSMEKQILVFTTDVETKSGDSFERLYAVEFMGEGIQRADKVNEGDMCIVKFDPQSRHWKDDKYFTSLRGWYIEKVGEGAEVEEKDEDDLPF